MITATDGSTLFGIAAMLLVAGLATGVLAGLFGVGGGAILVPVLRGPGAEPQDVVRRRVIPGRPIGRPAEIGTVEAHGQVGVVFN